MKQTLKILALEPYYAGSHKAFIDQLIAHSSHNWTLFTLPGYKWKWRMRHSAITFAEMVSLAVKKGQTWDAVFCSDMLNLAEWTALVPSAVRDLPRIIYFHENQLTYPVRFEDERDYQYVMTYFTSALCADKVWFNSAFHRNSFLEALKKFFRAMPDYQPTEQIERIGAKSAVFPVGITPISVAEQARPEQTERAEQTRQAEQSAQPEPLRILWAARWEHDKNPEDFFDALKILKAGDINFRLSVIGESFRDSPKVFGWAKDFFADEIDNWGYQHSRADYERVIAGSDVIVSTAAHEFFGITVLEAVSAGVFPVVPKRLSYPEILCYDENGPTKDFFYAGSVKSLADKLTELTHRKQNAQNAEQHTAQNNTRHTWQSQDLWPENLQPDDIVGRFIWDRLILLYDNALRDIVCNDT